jgi:hypothetical protein
MKRDNMNQELLDRYKIIDITKLLEARITTLMNQFCSLESNINSLLLLQNLSIYQIDKNKDPKVMESINKMVDIFIELKPIERLIRFKYKEFNGIFDRLEEVENERKHGKFFAFLACIPSKRTYIKRKTATNKPITTNSSLEHIEDANKFN